MHKLKHMKFSHCIESPLGFLQIQGTEHQVESISFLSASTASTKKLPLLAKTVEKQLALYFKGELVEFDFEHRQNGTAFQQAVWQELEKIPFGSTKSYFDIAVQLGDTKKIRAVGNANGKNNMAIVVPCHRVIGASGNLVGYAGGLWRKQWLLEHEAAATHGVLKLF